MATSSSSSSSSSTTINNGSQEYPYPSHVNPAGFLSIKLSDEINYGRWQKQMMCLMESHDMLGFIDGTLKWRQESGDSKKKAIKTAMEAKYREWKRSDTLVQGWIFGSLSEDVMDTVVDLHTAHDVWNKLNTTYSTSTAPITTSVNNTDGIKYIPLQRAILRGDWEKAQDIFNMNKDALTAKLNEIGESALHLAVSTCRNITFVENLLRKIKPKSLQKLVDQEQFNALHCAAIVGNTIASKMLVEKNQHLLFMVDEDGFLPIHRAIMNSHQSTFQYLLLVSKQYIQLSQQDGYQSPFEGICGAMLIIKVIEAGLLDLASELITEFPNMARTTYRHISALSSIAAKRDAYFSGTQYNFYKRFVYSHMVIENDDTNNANNIQDIENQRAYITMFVTMCRRWRFCFIQVIKSIYVKFWKAVLLQVPHIKRLQEDKAKHNAALMLLKCICEEVGKLNTFSELFEHYSEAFILAMENDTPEAIEAIVNCFPRAIWTSREDYFISQLVITNRCEKVYNIMVHHVDKHLHKSCTAKNGNNLLHLAGDLAPIHKLNLVSGAALQMQRELQWFEEVKKFVLPSDKEEKNEDAETPIMVFRRKHKELRKDGEEWMKKTADSYTITAALIITIAFAAAITVPGGNNDDTGKAIYATKPSFIIFAVSDAISLFASTTSLLLFLSILTARYREEDFLYSLPTRLILGLATLFLSVTSMMVAFSATLYLLFGQEKAWILIPIAALTSLPIASFATLQFPLLVELINSTYGYGIFGKQNDSRGLA